MTTTTTTTPTPTGAGWRRPAELELAPGAPALIEASAGTGKTWQISDMALRLVVDHGVAAERLLVITFTKAATAELRDRVRQRLAQARRVLRGEEPVDPAQGDATLTRLAALTDNTADTTDDGALTRTLALRRVSAALERFDQLTISTIHGFCQSTLTRLAFESGRGEVSEVSTDELDLLDELVRDTLHGLYARGERREVVRLGAMGLDYDELMSLGKEMLAAQEPELLLDDEGPRPCHEIPGVAAFDPLAAAAEIAGPEEDFIAWWGTDEAEACREAFRDNSQFRRGKNSGFAGDSVVQLFAYLESWLAPGGCDAWPSAHSVGVKVGSAKKSQKEPKLRRIVVETRLKDERRADFAGWPLVDRFEALYTAREAWRARVVPQARAWFACRVRPTIQAILRRRGRLTYATMLSDLADALHEQGPEGALARAMRARYEAVLVDEFQDTDAAQWRILRTAFAHPEARLVLVGDPKQAIYSFRGADLETYFQAAQAARERGALERNYRADGDVVRAVNHLFGPATWGPEGAPPAQESPFGVEALGYRAVDAEHPAARWGHPGLGRAAMELRWVDVRRLDGAVGGGASGKGSSKQELAPVVYEACAEEIAALLMADPPVEIVEAGAGDAATASSRPLRPGDLTVLVRTHREATAVRAALGRRGIPSVAVENRSVFASDAARWTLSWLEAVADPGDEKRARAAAATPLFGWTAAQLGAAMEAREEAREGGRAGGPEAGPLARWEAWIGQLKEAADRWGAWGFARTFEAALAKGQPARHAEPSPVGRGAGRPTSPSPAPARRSAPCCGGADEAGPEPAAASELAGDGRDEGGRWVAGVPAVLFGEDGERHATDLRHLTELLQAEERTRRAGPRGLALWLRERIHEASAKDGGTDEEERTVRLETDADAVQVATIHASKGLEYGVVLLPTVGFRRGSSNKKQAYARFRGESGPVLDLRAADTLGAKASSRRARDAARAEEMRLLYVALTRAKHHVVAWLPYFGGGNSGVVEESPLGRLVFGRAGVTSKTPLSPTAPEGVETAYEEALGRLAASSGGTVAWSLQRRPRVTRYVPRSARVLRLATTPWPSERRLGGAWQVSSFTALSKGRGIHEDEPQRPEDWMAAQASAAGTVAAQTEAGAGALSDAALEGEEAPREAPGVGLETGAGTSPWDRDIGLHGLRGGIDTGHWIHALFEELDFQSAQPRPAGSQGLRSKTGEPLSELVRRLALRFGIRDEARHALVARALPDILATPLDGGVTELRPGMTLSALGLRDRMDELRFDLRLGAGARWRYGDPERDVRVDSRQAEEALARAAASPILGAAPWLRRVLDTLRERARACGPGERPPTLFGRMAGIMTGSIDLAFRAPDRHGQLRYYVADYKTNLIGPPGNRRMARLGHYSRAWLAWEMAGHAYHLQALIYTVALHRLLRLRLGEGYDYDRDMGGHLYLFVRGMVGAQAPRDRGLAAGVWSDRWPREVVEAVDRAFDGTRRGGPHGAHVAGGQG